MKINLNIYLIFVLEDDEIARTTLSSMLKTLGFNVREYSNGFEALNDIKTGLYPKLIISDIKMPILDGISFAKLLSEMHLNIPVVFLTAYEEDEYIQESIKITNIKKFIKKPVLDIEKLSIQLRNIIKEQESFDKFYSQYMISWTTDLNGQITDASKAYCEISGYTKEEILNKKIKYKEVIKSVDENNFHSEEKKEINKHGYEYWIETTAQKLFNNDSIHIGYIFYAKDISAKKFHEQTQQESLKNDLSSLAETKAQLAIYNEELNAQNNQLNETQRDLEDTLLNFGVFFNHAPIPYIVINDKLELLTYNKCAIETFNIPIYLSYVSILKIMDRESFRILLNSELKNMSNNINVQIKMKLLNNERRRYKVNIVHNPVHDDQFLLSFVDIESETIYKEMIENQLDVQIKELELKNSQLLQQSKMNSIGEFIGNISHQWKQPLNLMSVIVSGTLFKLQLNDVDLKQLDRDLNTVMEQINYLSETIDTLNNIRKNEKELITAELNTKIKSTLNLIATKLKVSNIKLIDNLCEDEIMIETYKGQLTEVILNIINNAREQLLQKNIIDPFIKISTNQDTDSYFVSIEDNAGGIPRDIISKIFEPYFTTKSKENGTGLGLNMVYRIVTDSLKGKISVNNTKQGAIFNIELPKKITN